jgi:hypothetical protein
MLVRRGQRANEVVSTCRDPSETEPGIARNQPLEVQRRDNVEAVLAEDVAQEFGVLLHDKGGEVERALGDEPRLLGQVVVRGGGPVDFVPKDDMAGRAALAAAKQVNE